MRIQSGTEFDFSLRAGRNETSGAKGVEGLAGFFADGGEDGGEIVEGEDAVAEEEVDG